jgi:hypothetical protein
MWFPTKYKLTTEDVCLIVNDWEYGWETLVEKMGHLKEEEEQDKSDEELDEGKGNEQNNGIGNTLGPSTVESQQIVPMAREN